MDDIKQKFLKNLESQEKLIKRLKKENFNTAVLESRDLYFAYKKIREQLDRHLANVVLFCKKRMVRDVITCAMDLSKVEQRLKELQQAVSLVNLVGQYLPPLPKIDVLGRMTAGLNQPPIRNDLPEKKERAEAGGQENEHDLMSEQFSSDIIEKAICWSEKADMEGMDKVLALFEDSPQDQLILMKIRFEQRIIQVKQVLFEQGKIVDKLRREVEMLKIAKAYEKSAVD